jgi:hypothetical protein
MKKPVTAEAPKPDVDDNVPTAAAHLAQADLAKPAGAEKLATYFTDEQIEEIKQFLVIYLDGNLPNLVAASVASNLDENLPTLVAAAMPETSEAKAERERQERAKASAAAAAAKAEEIAAKAKEEAKAVKKAQRQRREDKEYVAELFEADAESIVSAKQVDYEKLIDLDAEYVILADDGTTYCIDFKVNIEPKVHLDIHRDRGVSVKIPIEVGNLQERFKFARLTLRKGDGAQEEGQIFIAVDDVVLRNEIVQPFWVGEGRKADFPANSLLFRVIA